MNRRSKDVKGVIKFPVNELPCSGEGGMVVKLWVIPSGLDGGVCCGAATNDFLYETFIGTDYDTYPDMPYLPENEEVSRNLLKAYDKERDIYFKSYWPHEIDGAILSKALLACVVLGSTGWSNGEWYANWWDLTPEGNRLVESLRAIYPNATFRLITFLDT